MRRKLSAMTLEAFLPRLSLLTWNADHFWSADLGRRAEKRAAFRSLIARFAPDVIFLQQTGRILHRPFREEWSRLGWDVHLSVLPDGTAGIIIWAHSSFHFMIVFSHFN